MLFLGRTRIDFIFIKCALSQIQHFDILLSLGRLIQCSTAREIDAGLTLEFKQDHLSMEALLDAGEEVVVKLTYVFLFSYLDRVSIVVNNGLYNSGGVCVLLVRLGHICEKLLHLKDKLP